MHRIRILLIEDDVIDRLAFERLIKKKELPYLVTATGSVKAAKQYLKQKKYDVIIADYLLNDGTAFDIFDSRSTIPIIFVTGKGDEDIAIKAIKLGAIEYLIKDHERNYLKLLPITIESAKKRTRFERRLNILESAVVNANDAFIITEIFDGQEEPVITYVNKAFTEITGYTSQEVMGSSTDFLEGKETNQHEIDRMQKAAQAGQAFRTELINYRKDGSKFWNEVNIVPVADKNDKISNFVLIQKDITERKQTEQDLLKAKLLAELSSKAKEKFLAHMSHEIRTPLNSVIGMTDLLLDMKPTRGELDYINAIKLSAENLLVIINDILDFSKIEAGKMKIENTVFDLKFLLQNLVRTVSYKINEKNLEIITSLPSNLPDALIGDPVRINQVLLNLLSNAIKFTHEGEVRLVVKMDELKKDSCFITFTVEDTGIGISAEKLQNIFDSFTQASSETTRRFGGTGLGLTISKQLVELLGGKLRAESEDGVGSSFSFTLELKKGNADELLYRDEPGAGDDISFPPSARVLVVEDHPLNQMLVKKLLERKGIEYEIASNGLEGLEKASSSDFDVILMDIQMPEMDGHESARHIRNDLSYPKSQTPIIALTAHATTSEREKSEQSGMNDYLSKPIDAKKFYHTLARYIKAGKKLRKTADKSKGKAVKNIPREKVRGIEGNGRATLKPNLSYLNRLFDNNEQLVNSMLEEIRNDLQGGIKKLREEYEAGNADEAKKTAHTFKPSFLYIGEKESEEELKFIEDHIHSEDQQEKIEALLGKLEKKASLLCAQIENHLREVSR